MFELCGATPPPPAPRWLAAPGGKPCGISLAFGGRAIALLPLGPRPPTPMPFPSRGKGLGSAAPPACIAFTGDTCCSGPPAWRAATAATAAALGIKNKEEKQGGEAHTTTGRAVTQQAVKAGQGVIRCRERAVLRRRNTCTHHHHHHHNASEKGKRVAAAINRKKHATQKTLEPFHANLLRNVFWKQPTLQENARLPVAFWYDRVVHTYNSFII